MLSNFFFFPDLPFQFILGSVSLWTFMAKQKIKVHFEIELT